MLAHGAQHNKALRRREKGLLLTEELPKLEKLVKKGKKVTQEIIDDRLSKVPFFNADPFSSTHCLGFLHQKQNSRRTLHHCAGETGEGGH